MRDPSGKDCGPAGRHTDGFFSEPGSERSRFHFAFLTLMEMHVKRRTARSRRKRAVEDQNGLALGATLSAHPQDLSSAPKLQRQKVFH
jgi:hypothetical protein